jgi:tetratricopeptide (TPR) repeat protein
MRLPDSSLRFVLSLFAVAASSVASAAQSYSSDNVRVRMRDSEQWPAIEQHLPDPATATPQTLETEADILRARRFPEDAREYYQYALARGGNAPALLNKLGVTELEMRNLALARAYFQRVVKVAKKDAEAWNNLGAVEYLDGATASAVSDYKKAVKLDRREAVFHSNLASAYFLEKNYGGARREIATAIDLDPEIFDRGGGAGGVTARVLSAEDHARFSFEMARMYARGGMEEQMLRSLAMAIEGGMNVQREMRKDVVLAKYEMDPRVVVLVRNAQALRAGRGATASAAGAAPALREPKPAVE